MQFTRASLIIALTGLSGNAFAQPVLDGSIAGDGYGGALSVQTTQTDFGDNASELNAAYAQIDNGVLYLTITGNLESNFNKLNIFIDSVAGGQNQIGPGTDEGGTNPNNDDWAENYSGQGPSADGNGNGFTFDAGFEADYLLILRNGNFGNDKFDVDYAVVGGGLAGFEEAFDIFNGSFTGANASALTNGVGVAYDNSNTAGIAGGTIAADPLAAIAVETGIELAIPLSEIGSPTGAIKVSAHVNGSNHDFLSNQSLGGFVAPQGNLGGDGAAGFNNDVSLIDLNQFDGDQFFQISLAGRADIDFDGDIDDADFGLAFAAFTGPDNGPPENFLGDIDGDGDVDDADYGLFFAAFTGPGVPASVPEPTSLALLGLGGLLMARRRRAS